MGAVAKAVHGRRAEHLVGRERFTPLGHVEVAGDDGGRALVAFGMLPTSSAAFAS